MPDLSEKELLTRIHKSLDEIKAVLVLTNQDKLMAIKKSMLKEGSMKSQVYNLCDGSKTTQDIAQAIQKSVEYTNSYLSILRREGFISTVEKEGKQVHEQVF